MASPKRRQCDLMTCDFLWFFFSFLCKNRKKIEEENDFCMHWQCTWVSSKTMKMANERSFAAYEIATKAIEEQWKELKEKKTWECKIEWRRRHSNFEGLRRRDKTRRKRFFCVWGQSKIKLLIRLLLKATIIWWPIKHYLFWLIFLNLIWNRTNPTKRQNVCLVLAMRHAQTISRI